MLRLNAQGSASVECPGQELRWQFAEIRFAASDSRGCQSVRFVWVEDRRGGIGSTPNSIAKSLTFDRSVGSWLSGPFFEDIS